MPAALLSACVVEQSDSDPAGDPSAEQQQEGEICLLNTCNSDSECGGCSEGRNTCLVAENRCVGCDPNTGAGCDPGMTCSSWGICSPDGQTCEVDPMGEPLFQCTHDLDCLACSPMQQVCGVDGKCTACTESNTDHCSQAEECVSGQCQYPTQCSNEVPCDDGMHCQNDTCVPGCGMDVPTPGQCSGDHDCQYCGDGNADWTCITDPGQTLGQCAPGGGCTDLGPNFAALPPPWNAVTETCSSDANCIGIGVDYNVGELIRDKLGIDEINLGFATVEIQDAYVPYDMGKCASIEVGGGAQCGVCVPCMRDEDCQPIAVDPLLWQLFSEDPLAGLAGSMLIDMMFGASVDHGIHFFCSPVTAGHGACTPCSNPFAPC